MLFALSSNCDLKRVLFCLMVAVLGTTHLWAQWTLMDPDPEILAYTNFLGQGMSFVDFNLDGDGVIGVSDILELLSFFGLVCADLLAD